MVPTERERGLRSASPAGGGRNPTHSIRSPGRSGIHAETLANLGIQPPEKLDNFAFSDAARKVADLDTVPQLTMNPTNPADKVAVATIQRLYSALRGDEGLITQSVIEIANRSP